MSCITFFLLLWQLGLYMETFVIETNWYLEVLLWHQSSDPALLHRHHPTYLLQTNPQLNQKYLVLFKWGFRDKSDKSAIMCGNLLQIVTFAVPSFAVLNMFLAWVRLIWERGKFDQNWQNYPNWKLTKIEPPLNTFFRWSWESYNGIIRHYIKIAQRGLLLLNIYLVYVWKPYNWSYLFACWHSYLHSENFSLKMSLR